MSEFGPVHLHLPSVTPPTVTLHFGQDCMSLQNNTIQPCSPKTTRPGALQPDQLFSLHDSIFSVFFPLSLSLALSLSCLLLAVLWVHCSKMKKFSFKRKSRQITAQNYERIIEHEIFIFSLMSSGPPGPLTQCVCVLVVVGGDVWPPETPLTQR